MILTKNEILEALKTKELDVVKTGEEDEAVKLDIGPCSIDLGIDQTEFRVTTALSGTQAGAVQFNSPVKTFKFSDAPSVHYHYRKYDEFIDNKGVFQFRLSPNQILVTRTEYQFNLGDTLCGFVKPRYTFSTAGLLIREGFIQPNHKGCIALVVQNVTDYFIEFSPAYKLAQLILMRSKKATGESRYDMKPDYPEMSNILPKL